MRLNIISFALGAWLLQQRDTQGEGDDIRSHRRLTDQRHGG